MPSVATRSPGTHQHARRRPAVPLAGMVTSPPVRSTIAVCRDEVRAAPAARRGRGPSRDPPAPRRWRTGRPAPQPRRRSRAAPRRSRRWSSSSPTPSRPLNSLRIAPGAKVDAPRADCAAGQHRAGHVEAGPFQRMRPARSSDAGRRRGIMNTRGPSTRAGLPARRWAGSIGSAGSRQASVPPRRLRSTLALTPSLRSTAGTPQFASEQATRSSTASDDVEHARRSARSEVRVGDLVARAARPPARRRRCPQSAQTGQMVRHVRARQLQLTGERAG